MLCPCPWILVWQPPLGFGCSNPGHFVADCSHNSCGQGHPSSVNHSHPTQNDKDINMTMLLPTRVANLIGTHTIAGIPILTIGTNDENPTLNPALMIGVLGAIPTNAVCIVVLTGHIPVDIKLTPEPSGTRALGMAIWPANAHPLEEWKSAEIDPPIAVAASVLIAVVD